MPPIELNLALFENLLQAYGPMKWWPSRSRFEIIAGAILAQSVSWENAKLSVYNLRKHRLLSAEAIRGTGTGTISRLIKSSRFPNQKAHKLKTFSEYLCDRHGGSLDEMFAAETETLRSELLLLKGIGRETADCILLYAAGKLSFVSDAYTKRFLERYGVISAGNYEQIRNYFMKNLPRDIGIYREFHALIVHHCKNICRKEPLCGVCSVKIACKGAACRYAASSASGQIKKEVHRCRSSQF